ncbi:MAG TPA: PAS domain S-box protein [Nitrospirota bacterium]|nr:PAS domain S-box protein [Nitrospirota bacterium]
MNKRTPFAIRKSFGLKVLFAFVIVIVVSLTVYTVIVAVREGDKIKRDLVEKGELFAGILAHSSVVGIFAENTDLLREAAAGVLGQKDVLHVSMYNSRLKLLYASGGMVSDANPPPVVKQDIVLSGDATLPKLLETSDSLEFIKPVSRISLPGADESLYLGTPNPDEAVKVIGYVRIVLSKDSYRREILSLAKQNAVMMLLFIAFSGVIVSVAVKKVMRPLEKLTGNVRAFEKGLAVEPTPIDSEDEVGNLAVAFNEMMVARRQAEGLLRESEDRYRGLVELSPDAIYVQQDGRIMFTNATGTKLLGVSESSQVLGRPTMKYISENNRGATCRRLQRVQEEMVTDYLIPLQFVQPGGTVVDVEAVAAPFTFKGQPAVLVIARDVTERKGLEAKIRNYQKELYSVAAEMSSLESRVEERERHLIAADLHDYVGQNLIILNFKLNTLRKSLTETDAVRHVDEILENLGKIIEYTRSLTVELNPPVLVEIGFKAAVESLAEGFERTHGIVIDVEDDGQPEQFDNNTRYLVFRCVRELLLNTVKHAQATRAEIFMTRTGDSMRVIVSDNGIGFDVASITHGEKGFGLFAIRERMKRLGGHCDITSNSGLGTKITLDFPLIQEQQQVGKD